MCCCSKGFDMCLGQCSDIIFQTDANDYVQLVSFSNHVGPNSQIFSRNLPSSEFLHCRSALATGPPVVSTLSECYSCFRPLVSFITNSFDSWTNYGKHFGLFWCENGERSLQSLITRLQKDQQSLSYMSNSQMGQNWEQICLKLRKRFAEQVSTAFILEEALVFQTLWLSWLFSPSY